MLGVRHRPTSRASCQQWQVSSRELTGAALARIGEAAALVAGTVVVTLRTRLSPLWPIAAGALVGALALA